MEVALSGAGLVLLSPLLLIVALVIKLTSEGPVLFRQERCGRFGRPFMLLKFRSMVDCSHERGPLVTAGGDARVTRFGSFLRRTKLDELPQLWNVVRGEMSLVGPRPEVPGFLRQYPQQSALLLQQRPGITDAVTVRLRDEESLLAGVEDAERFYVETLLPRKLGAAIREGWRRSFWRDVRVLLATVVPGLARLAPAVDLRPLADLYTLPAARPQSVAAAQAGRVVALAANRRQTADRAAVTDESARAGFSA